MPRHGKHGHRTSALKPAEATSNIGNIVGDASRPEGSAQDKYWGWKYMTDRYKEKEVTAGKAVTVDACKVPEYMLLESEEEVLKQDILKRISKYTESSPEFSQLRDICGGTKDRFLMAQHLAEIAYDKVRGEAILTQYALPEATLKAQFEARQKEAHLQRTKVLSGAADAKSFVSGFLGIPVDATGKADFTAAASPIVKLFTA